MCLYVDVVYMHVYMSRPCMHDANIYIPSDFPYSFRNWCHGPLDFFGMLYWSEGPDSSASMPPCLIFMFSRRIQFCSTSMNQFIKNTTYFTQWKNGNKSTSPIDLHSTWYSKNKCTLICFSLRPVRSFAISRNGCFFAPTCHTLSVQRQQYCSCWSGERGTFSSYSLHRNSHR